MEERIKTYIFFVLGAIAQKRKGKDKTWRFSSKFYIMFANYATADRGSTNYDGTNHMPQQSAVKSNVPQCCSVFYNLQSHTEENYARGKLFLFHRQGDIR